MRQYQRVPHRETSRDSSGLLARARQLISEGRFFDGVDLFEQAIDADPLNATPYLAELYRIYVERQKSASRYDLYQGRHYTFPILPGEKILDVGSGHLPFPFATHLSDISTSNDRIGRAGAPFKEVNGKPSYEINVEEMPFKDKEFDFIYCSHVLEHTEDPERACRELMRVGKRGYIETPTRGKDLFLNTAKISNHNWFVEKIDGRLIFFEYTEADKEGLTNSLLMDMHLSPQTLREEAFSALVILKSDKMNTMLMWDESFECEVRRHSAPKTVVPSTVGGGAPLEGNTTNNSAPSAQRVQSPFLKRFGHTPRCVFVHTYEPSLLEAVYRDEPRVTTLGYNDHLAAIISKGFEGSDFYSNGLREAGWETFDIISNSSPLQLQWAHEHRSAATGDALVLEQLSLLKPDVVYCHDVHTTSRHLLLEMKRRGWLVVGQNASSITNEPLECYDLLFSSLPDQVALFRSLGIAAYYQPLSFEPRLLSRIPLEDYSRRSIDVSFVGVYASPTHQEFTQLLEGVSRTVPLSIWGTGNDYLAPTSPLHSRCKGDAYGTELYGVLAKSRITINHHRNVWLKNPSTGAAYDASVSTASNARLFEATGFGTLLVTDYKDNLSSLFEVGKEVLAYRTREECAELIRYYLMNPAKAEAIAKAGQKRTLTDYVYPVRMREAAEIFERHLRYRAESECYRVPDTVSCEYESIEKGEMEALRSSWKNDSIPLKQRGLVQEELLRMYRGKSAKVFEVSAALLRSVLKPGESLLEIGCSSGYCLEIFEYLLGHRLKYTGVDYSPSMIEMAKDFYPNYDFVVADGASLPWGNNSFDHVASGGVLLLVDNYEEHVAETIRVARRTVLALRTPVCRARPTHFTSTLTYGIRAPELRFNEDHFVSLFLERGCKLLNAVEYHSIPSDDQFYVSYLFEKTV